jgi:hypothetical protein
VIGVRLMAEAMGIPCELCEFVARGRGEKRTVEAMAAHIAGDHVALSEAEKGALARRLPRPRPFAPAVMAPGRASKRLR